MLSAAAIYVSYIFSVGCFFSVSRIFSVSCVFSVGCIFSVGWTFSVCYIFSVSCVFSASWTFYVSCVFSVCSIIFYRMLEVFLLLKSTVSSTSLYFEAIPHSPYCLNILRLRRIEFNLLANLLDVDRYGRDVTDRLHVPDLTEQLVL